MFEDIITFDQACEFLGVSPKTLYGYTYKKIIPYYRPRGRHVYFRKSELAEFVTSITAGFFRVSYILGFVITTKFCISYIRDS